MALPNPLLSLHPLNPGLCKLLSAAKVAQVRVDLVGQHRSTEDKETIVSLLQESLQRLKLPCKIQRVPHFGSCIAMCGVNLFN